MFVDSVHFLNSLLDNLVYHLSQDFNANALDLVKKKNFFFLRRKEALNNLSKFYLAKKKKKIVC